jgi:hypothetical protein
MLSSALASPSWGIALGLVRPRRPSLHPNRMPGPQNLIAAADMSSEPDDLEQALQENLKIRRKLARKTWEVRERNAKDRVGWALYHLSLAFAGLWILLWPWMLYGGFSEEQSRGVEHATRLFMPNPLKQIAFVGIPVLLLYSLGRSIRYALSGE